VEGGYEGCVVSAVKVPRFVDLLTQSVKLGLLIQGQVSEMSGITWVDKGVGP
jgi:hypothetical protein